MLQYSEIKLQAKYSKDADLHIISALLFLHIGYGYLRFYPGIEHLILYHVIFPRLSHVGCTLVVLELTHMVAKRRHCYIMLKRHHHIMSHLSVFMSFWEPFLKHNLMVSKIKNLSSV